jgi:hypothetical protein
MAKRAAAKKTVARKTVATRAGARKAAGTRSSQKRDLVKTRSDARYAKRKPGGQFKDMDDVGRSLKADRRQVAKKKVKPGYGDQGDQKKKRKTTKGN